MAVVDSAVAARFLGGQRGASGEQRLWAAVLSQAISDIVTGDEPVPSNWMNTRDFAIVAECAGLDPYAARDGLLRRLALEQAA
ncbi:MAG: hypothetical protein ACRC67_03890 [Inquilinus sp.]|uniref:hypothetical protein n=1 Tax=Inquilinus sp. TaxID=1932117 RepID=UPI003F3ABDC6